MKKADFRKIVIENVEGEKEIADISKQLGNMMYMQGQNIEECELGRDIYHKGEVELNEVQETAVKRFSMNFSYIMRTAICEAISG